MTNQIQRSKAKGQNIWILTLIGHLGFEIWIFLLLPLIHDLRLHLVSIDPAHEQSDAADVAFDDDAFLHHRIAREVNIIFTFWTNCFHVFDAFNCKGKGVVLQHDHSSKIIP